MWSLRHFQQAFFRHIDSVSQTNIQLRAHTDSSQGHWLKIYDDCGSWWIGIVIAGICSSRSFANDHELTRRLDDTIYKEEIVLSLTGATTGLRWDDWAALPYKELVGFEHVLEDGSISSAVEQRDVFDGEEVSNSEDSEESESDESNSESGSSVTMA